MYLLQALIVPSQGRGSHTDPWFLSLLLSPSTAASVDICRHNSFQGVFVLSSHHMTVGPTIAMASRILSVLHATPASFWWPHSFTNFSVRLQISTAAFSFMFSPVAPALSLSLSRPLLHTSSLFLSVAYRAQVPPGATTSNAALSGIYFISGGKKCQSTCKNFWRPSFWPVPLLILSSFVRISKKFHLL